MKLIAHIKEDRGLSIDIVCGTLIKLGNNPFYMLYDYSYNEAVHGFVVVKVVEVEGELQYEYDNNGCNDYSPDIELADVYLYGSIRFDGCSNWMYPENNEDCMLHFCGLEQAVLVAEVMKKAYEIAEQNIDGFDR